MEITYRGEGYAFAAVSYTRIVREDLVQAIFKITEGPRVLIEAHRIHRAHRRTG